MQPLSFVIPRTDRFLALNKTSMKSNEDLPGIKLAELFQAEKDGPTSSIWQLVDCSAKRRADWQGDMPPTMQDINAKAKWFELETEAPLLHAVCDG